MKKIVLFLFLFPKFLFAQSYNKWKLFQGENLVKEGISGSLKVYIAPKKNNKNYTVVYYPAAQRRSWTNTLILMDTNRIEIVRKVTTKKNKSFVIDKKYLDEYKKIIVYITSQPTDPKLAAKVRVGTVPLVAIKLLN